MVCLFIIRFYERANRLAEAHLLLEAVVDRYLFGMACFHVVDVVVLDGCLVLEEHFVELARVLKLHCEHIRRSIVRLLRSQRGASDLQREHGFEERRVRGAYHHGSQLFVKHLDGRVGVDMVSLVQCATCWAIAHLLREAVIECDLVGSVLLHIVNVVVVNYVLVLE